MWLMMEATLTVTITTFIYLIAFGVGKVSGEYRSKVAMEESVDGDYRIAGFFNIDYRDTHELSITDTMWAEVMKYVIKGANKRLGRNIFGYQIYDIYDKDHDALTEAVLDILIQHVHTVGEKEHACHCHDINFNLKKLIGIVGAVDSSDSIYANELVQYHHIPMISYASTSPKLSDPEKYPNFFRTVPTDLYQARFVTNFLKKFDWTHVLIIAADDSYGRWGIHLLHEEFHKKANNICIEVEKTFSVPVNTEEVDIIMKGLSEADYGNIIILWAGYKDVKFILQRAESYGVKSKTWIISEGSGRDPWFHSPANKLEGNILVLVPGGGEDKEFERFFFNMTYEENLSNPWIKRLFERYHTNRTFDSTMEYFKDKFDFRSRIGFISDAVTSFVRAFSNYTNHQYGCRLEDLNCNSSIVNHKAFVDNYLKPVKFKGLANENISFDSNGDIMGAVFQIYMASKDERRFHLIADWNYPEDNIRIHTSNTSNILKKVKSRCSDLCPKGFYSKFHHKCCWYCLECRNNYYKHNIGHGECAACPDGTLVNSDRTACIKAKSVTLQDSNLVNGVYVLSCVGGAITLIFIITFIKHRNSPVVRSSSFYPSIAQFSCHFLLFVLPVCLLGEETTLNCAVREYGMWALITMSSAITLAKATHILNVFNLKTKLDTWKKVQLVSCLYIVIILSMIGEICLVILLLQSKLTIETQIVNRSKFEIYKSCYRKKDYVSQFLYTLLLQVASGIQGIRGWKLPASYNEGKFITLAAFSHAVLNSAGIVLIRSAKLNHIKHIRMVLISLVSNLIYVVILYERKVRVCLFTPRKNTYAFFERMRMEYISDRMRSLTGVSVIPAERSRSLEDY